MQLPRWALALADDNGCSGSANAALASVTSLPNLDERALVAEAQAGNRADRYRIRWVEGCVLIGTISQGILQIVIHAKSGTNHRSLAEGTPSDGQAGLRQKLCAIDREERISHLRLSGDDAIVENIVGGASVRFVPPAAGFRPESEREHELRGEMNRILEIPGAEKGAPAQGRRCRIVQQASCAPEKVLQAGEGHLPELAQREFLV